MPTFRNCRLAASIAFACGAYLALPGGANAAEKASPPPGCVTAASVDEAQGASGASKPAFPPPQIEVEAPFAPSAFAGGGLQYLFYELHVRNFASDRLALQRIDVLDADNAEAAPVAVFSAAHLADMVSLVGVDEPQDVLSLGGGQSAIAFLCAAFDGKAPARLRHRAVFDGAIADSPPMGTRNTKVKSLASPVTGPGWTGADGPRLMSHHRMGLIVIDGAAQNARRFAIDWKKLKDGSSFTGDALDAKNYYAYGEPVVAVGKGRVVTVVDGIPDNIPRTPAGFSPAVAITLETVAGNSIVLDLGDGEFAYYAHLKPGSIRVKEGDKVRRGEALAQIGGSGDAREPHLHFQLTTTPAILGGEGIPYVIDRFCVRDAAGGCDARRNEFPLGDNVFDFPGAGKDGR